MTHKAVFLDRDDTIIDDPGYIRNPEQIRLIPGAAQALKQMKEMGYLLVVITNQSGVARGFVTEERLEDIHQELRKQLSSEGAELDGIYYCPYHPDGEIKNFSMESNLRKPNAGMFFQAEEDLEIDLAQSWMIGDSYRDIQAGNAAGCHTILVDVPGKIREKKKNDPEPDRKAVNLREAVNIIRMYEFHQKAKAAKQSSEQDQSPDDSSESSEPEPSPQDTSDQSAIEPEAVAEETAPEPETNIETEIEEEPPSEEPEPAKVYTAKPTPQTEPASPAEPVNQTHHLLEEIALRLKRKDREGLYQEFSVFKLLAVMLQAIAVLCLIFSICLWLSPKDHHIDVQTMLGFTIALQLIVITLLMMHSRD